MLARVGGANATGKRSNIKTIVVRRDVYQAIAAAHVSSHASQSGGPVRDVVDPPDE